MQMEESVNWTELAYALKDLVDPIAQNQVFETLAVCKYIIYISIAYKATSVASELANCV